jgi:hypothetical protein
MKSFIARLVLLCTLLFATRFFSVTLTDRISNATFLKDTGCACKKYQEKAQREYLQLQRTIVFAQKRTTWEVVTNNFRRFLKCSFVSRKRKTHRRPVKRPHLSLVDKCFR